MNSLSDQQLLRDYIAHHSETAFTELVQRHVDLVYFAAFRMTGEADAAKDVTQAVFIALAQNTARLADHPVLSGWLHTTARNLAANAIRADVRRRQREQEAATMNKLHSTPDNLWEAIAPHLEAAIGELSEPERDAVLLRYFERKSAQEIALILGISDVAAQKRVSRAVERLREFFSKRNVTVGAGGLAVLISANAVQSAPVGLAATISAAALLTGTTIQTSTLIAATKTIAMTTIQKTLITATIAVIAGAAIYEARQAAQLREQDQTLRQQQVKQVQQLQDERDGALKQLALLSAKPVPHLPAPPMQAPTGDLQSGNSHPRVKDRGAKLTAEQVEAYLQASGRKASSLLAAYRTSGDPALLKEAMEKYPNDPLVAFEAVYSKNASPEEQRQWLNAFEQSAPGNALANYLSAFNYFNSGQIELGIQELTAASGKQLDDYTLNRIQADEEAYLSAGYSAAEAERISDSSLMMSQLSQIKKLGVDLVDLANTYNTAGNSASAQSAFQMAINLGQRFADPSTDPMLISQMVGMAIEKIALTSMDPNSPYGNNGQTVQGQLNQITQINTAINELVQQGTPLLPTLSDQDMVNYENLRRASGEIAALQWVVSKYGQK